MQTSVKFYYLSLFSLNLTVDLYGLRTKANLDLNDELARAKRMLDEKYFEAGRLRDEAVAKGDQNQDQRSQL